MRAAVMRRGTLTVEDVPDPEPRPWHVLCRTLACGICGSDLHMVEHAEHLLAAAREVGLDSGTGGMDLDRGVVLGHEFVVEVVEAGPEVTGWSAGQRAVSMPMTLKPEGGFEGIGYSSNFPGGYGELMLLHAGLMIPVADDVDARHAALTEPMAVGRHAVAMARMPPTEPAVVVGCGPVGLAVIAALRQAGSGAVVAVDFSARRREIAGILGADEVVDAAVESGQAAMRRRTAGSFTTFECVGVPGVLDAIMREAPRGGRVIVAGVCMDTDRIQPMIGIYKELSMQFVIGYSPDEFLGTYTDIAAGTLPAANLLTGSTDVEGVPGAFATLASPHEHAKILVEYPPL